MREWWHVPKVFWQPHCISECVLIVGRFFVEETFGSARLNQYYCSATVLLLLGVSVISIALASEGSVKPDVIIYRKKKVLEALDATGKTITQFPIDIGRGGPGRKRNMQDEITPTGAFTVDLILSQDSRHNAISKQAHAHYATNKDYGRFVKDNEGLVQLFENMSSLDFNGDGKPDRAYGIAYIGVDSEQAVTGPKFSRFRGKPYWFSIAIHGTPDGKVGQPSGGCVHLEAEALKNLLEKRILRIGSRVVITD